MFQLHEMTEAHVASVTNRVEKHGEEDKPAVSIAVEITAANTLLDLIDPKIRHSLYQAVEGQEQLPGIEPATPVLRCNSFERHTLPTKYEGWTLAVDDGIDGTEPMVFGGVKADKFSVEAKQGGSIVLRLRLGTSDVDADKLGKLAMHNGQSIWITLTAPKPAEDAIDGTTAAFEADHQAGGDERDAADLFAEQHGPGDDDDSEGGDADARTDDAAAVAEGLDEPWPFPKDAQSEASPQSVVIETSRPGSRTARGRDRTKAALEAGAKA